MSGHGEGGGSSGSPPRPLPQVPDGAVPGVRAPGPLPCARGALALGALPRLPVPARPPGAVLALLPTQRRGLPAGEGPGGAALGALGWGGAQRRHRGAGADGVPSCRARCWWRARGIPAASAPGQVSPGLGAQGGHGPVFLGVLLGGRAVLPAGAHQDLVPHAVCPRCRWQCDGRPHGADDGAHPLQPAGRAPQQPAGHLPTASPGRYVRPPLTQRVPLGTSPAVSPPPRRGRP